jgi:hypothetical protein
MPGGSSPSSREASRDILAGTNKTEAVDDSRVITAPVKPSCTKIASVATINDIKKVATGEKAVVWCAVNPSTSALSEVDSSQLSTSGAVDGGGLSPRAAGITVGVFLLGVNSLTLRDGRAGVPSSDAVDRYW